MRIKNYCLFLLLIFCITAMLQARGNRENSVITEYVQVTGIVRLVGTALFPEIVISGLEHEWYAAAEERDKLYEFQHHAVTVEAEETIIELRFANGQPAGIRRELRNIKITDIH